MRVAILRLVLAGGMAAAPSLLTAAAEPPILSCRTQVLFHCRDRCEFGPGPADLHIDLRARRIDYCRGGQCDEGDLAVTETPGQWDDEPYLGFDATVAGGKRISGIVSLRSLAFYAKGDAGDMFGTCERP